MSSSKRRNGLTAKHSRMQISTWFVLPVLVSEFLFFSSPILPLAASIVCTFLFLSCCLATVLFGYMATAIDPMDHRLSHDEDGYKDPFSGVIWKQILKLPGFQLISYAPGVPVVDEPVDEHNNDVNEDKTKYCWVCEHDVAEESMHCRYCNKCVSKFDHHCQWLNTCVGERNYPFFYKTLWSITALLVVHICVGLGLSIDILAEGTSKQRADDWFSANLSELVVAMNLFFVVFDFICLTLILQLLSFHMKLRAQNLTTYKYILKDNVEKRELNKKKAARKSKRTVAMGHAKREKQTILTWRLAMGKHLEKLHPCLDPLPQDEPQQETTNGKDKTTTNGTANGAEEHKEDEDIETSRS